jgi:hypothetical protein
MVEVNLSGDPQYHVTTDRLGRGALPERKQEFQHSDEHHLGA